MYKHRYLQLANINQSSYLQLEIPKFVNGISLAKKVLVVTNLSTSSQLFSSHGKKLYMLLVKRNPWSKTCFGCKRVQTYYFLK